MSPSKVQSLLQQAVALHREGGLDAAEKIYRQIRAAVPKNFDALHLSGLLAYQQGRAEDAVALLTKAHQLDRKSVQCEMRLAIALIACTRSAEAEKHLRHVLERSPDYVEGWDNLAYCLKTQDRLVDAVACHRKVVALKPDFANGWYNFGLTLGLLGYPDESIPCHERALSIDPEFHAARLGRAQALQQSNRIVEAVDAYGELIAANPTQLEIRSCRLFALHNLDGITREQLFAEHVAFGRAIPDTPAITLPNSPDAARRLRIAILSPDLREHSCAYFLEPLLRHLDREQFEVFLYHDHFRVDAVSTRLQALAATWRNFVGQPNTAVERAIRSDAPDILIDLAGHTGLSNRLPLFARRLAPVQISYLGYPNTTGLDAMDYRLTDAFADPVGEADPFATEKLLRFAPTAWCYSAPVDAPLPNAIPRAPDAPVTFGCFNSFGKVTDAMLGTWARLLAEVPQARLLLKGAGFEEPAAQAKLRERLSRCGLPPERVEFLGRTPGTAQHLACYHQVDIALDTFPYHGTTTTCEALWMGVPVVSIAGDRHVSRVGVSLLNAAGHSEWIARDADEYVRIASALVSDRVRLQKISAGLRDELRASALLDHAGQSARFAETLRDCWRNWCSLQTPALVDAGQVVGASA
jgi:predicted O-linked N-acetylglucosamine transferase (SPINDLY family)